MAETMQFSIDYVKMIEENPLFMILDAYILSLECDNYHKTWFTKENVDKAIPSLANIPLVCVWNDFNGKLKEHARNILDHKQLDSIGVVPESNMAEYVEFEGKIFLKARCVIWKSYHKQIVDKIKSDSLKGINTKLSMEIFVHDAEKMDNGYVLLKDFSFVGICLLGHEYTSAIPDAQVEIIRYSTEEYKEMVDTTNKQLSTYAITDEIKDNAKRALEMKQSNTKLKEIALDISESDLMTFAKIEWILNKINSLRKEENLLFYGGSEMKELAENIVQKDFIEYAKKGDTSVGEQDEVKDEKKDFAETDGDKKDFVEGDAKTDEPQVDEPETEGEAKEEYVCKTEYAELEVKYAELETKYAETIEKYSALTTDFEKAQTENTQLKEYKFGIEKKELEAKADDKIQSYAEYVDEKEIKSLKEVLFSTGFDAFSKELSATVMPKMEAKIATFSVTKQVEGGLEFTVTPVVVEMNEEPKSVWDRVKTYIK